jgi:hypothetical protein
LEERVEILFFALILLGIPFVLPIVAWVSARRARARIQALEEVVESQRLELSVISQRLSALTRPPAADVAAPAAAPGPARAARQEPAVAPIAPVAAVEPPKPPTAPAPPVPVKPAPIAPAAAAPVAPAPATPAPAPVVPAPAAPAARPAAAALPTPASAAPPRPPAPPVRVPPPPVEPPPPPAPAFDWESLVGVKLFSAIAGIALVVAAVSFLKYSIDHGWLQPTVRVAIGIIVAVVLLVTCELKAARRYPVTANAMDAAAIAILFSTFFSAHALWNLIPASLTFGLLAMVTALAVLLSIRRESLFIAVLGLLGGFATPALLSTGENRPVPLFAYLLLLNIGLAWVAFKRGWTLLTWMTLVLTTIYQWGWVFKFLDEASLPLAVGIFLVFPLAAMSGVLVGGRLVSDRDRDEGNGFEQSALMSSVLPLLFAVYLAVVPAYGAHATLLFGFLLLLDLGLLAIAIARRQSLLHATGALTTMIVMAVWMTFSYEASGSWSTVLAFASAFVVLYLAAPLVSRWWGRTLEDAGARAQYAAPLLLFVFPLLVGFDPALTNPWPLAGTLLVLVLLIAWRALAGGVGPLYYIAAFFAIAFQAVWSSNHLILERLGTAVALYTSFGLVSLGVPIVARRYVRPLQPAWGSGVVLLVSLGLLLFLSTSAVASSALWALALLLAILNAGLFVESAAGRLPLTSQVGSVLSWLILMNWWARAAASVGVLPSLSVMVGLTLVTLAGHGWSVRSARDPESEDDAAPAARFRHGLYLGLIGHLFLLLLVFNREWALPPWPIFGALLVITLATTATAIWIRTPVLHQAGCIATALVVMAWAGAAGSQEWGTTAVLAAAAASAYALVWIPLGLRTGEHPAWSTTACAVLFVGELSLVCAVGGGVLPPFPLLVLAHAVNLCVLLALVTHYQWQHIAIAAVAPAWLAVLQWQVRDDLNVTWPQLLILSAALYTIFAAYPFVLGRRAQSDREPYLVAVIASAMAFFGARAAFLAGDLEWMIGIIPIVEGAVLAVLLRHLLRMEAPGERDMGRLALIAGAALAFVTVAIPLQLSHQWITIGWALEGAALAWIYRRIPHRGLLYFGVALLGTVFVRLAMNPEIFLYEPRGEMRIFNWYLYTYLVCAVALLIAGRWLSKTDDRIIESPRPSQVLPAAGVILLFYLLNIEIADFYATGPTLMFRFGATLSQDLTYTIGWLVFGLALLAAGIYIRNRPARVTAVAMIAVTTFKCFLYDLGSLEGLYRVASFVGLAMSLALVALALQKFVLSKPSESNAGSAS